MVATTGATTVLVPVAVFFGGCAERGGLFCIVSSRNVDDCVRIVDGITVVGYIFLPVQGKAFGGDVVVSTLRRVVGIFSAVSNLGGGAAMIALIGTLKIGVGGVSGAFSLGRAGIARGSGGGGRGATGWKPGGGAVSLHFPQRWW